MMINRCHKMLDLVVAEYTAGMRAGDHTQRSVMMRRSIEMNSHGEDLRENCRRRKCEHPTALYRRSAPIRRRGNLFYGQCDVLMPRHQQVRFSCLFEESRLERSHLAAM